MENGFYESCKIELTCDIGIFSAEGVKLFQCGHTSLRATLCTSEQRLRYKQLCRHKVIVMRLQKEIEYRTIDRSQF